MSSHNQKSFPADTNTNSTTITTAFELGTEELYALITSGSSLAAYGGVGGIAAKLHSSLLSGLVCQRLTTTTSTTEDLHHQSVSVPPSAPPLPLPVSTSTTSLTGGGGDEEPMEGPSLSSSAFSKQHQQLLPQDYADRIAKYGTNTLPAPVSFSFLHFCWEAIQDRTLILLLVAAAVEVAYGIYVAVSSRQNASLIDGFAVVFAVLVVVSVTAGNDYNKQSQFRKLNSYSRGLAHSKVVRNGHTIHISNSSILVGDILVLSVGDIIPADGLYISGYNLRCDESTMTGESESVKKSADKDPFLLSGTKVVDGMAKMLVIATGANSCNGRTLLLLNVEPEETPLQKKLSALADQIAKFGIAAAVLMVVILLVVYFAVQPNRAQKDMTSQLLNLFIDAITLVVVAVPEGLPLAVTLALAHATLRMLKDNNLVRHLAACETMGNATTICSDKTGTLTQNRMTIVKGVLVNEEFDLVSLLKFGVGTGRGGERQRAMLKFACQCINVNSTAEETEREEDGEKEFVGSKTEIALLEFTRKLGFSYDKDRAATRIEKVIPFSSARKRMSTIVFPDSFTSVNNHNSFKNVFVESNNLIAGKRILFSKGASEIILGGCTKYLNESGDILPLSESDRQRFADKIEEFANDALRTLCVAFKPLDSLCDSLAPETVSTLIQAESIESVSAPSVDGGGVAASSREEDRSNLIFIGVFGIQDPLREEVAASVLQCQKAGVVVRMVTGDNIATARSIAKQCGILTEGGLIMEGPAFRRLSPERMDEIVPQLQVLARSSPQDKQILVNCLRNLGETVAVTGDGTNDAPALKSADIGFSMGIAGTEVAKEASDIVLMDDNFVSLVKAIMWGRSVYDSVRKFLQFQLTVNVTAVVVTIFSSLISTITSEHKVPFSALGAVQLLWVNLIMDTFAALALATDPPTEALLNRRPERKSDDLINRDMWCQIIGQAIYQIIISFIMYGMADQIFGVDGSLYIDSETGVKIYNTTMVFNVFVLCQLFNEVNCRSITRDINIFRGVHKNNTFMFIFALSMLLQVIIVQFGGPVFKTIPLQWREWLVCIAFGFGSIPVGFLIRIIPPIYPRGEKDPELKQKMEEQEAIMDAYELERVVIESVERTGGRPLNLEDRKLLQGAIKKTALQLRVLGDFKSASREVFTEGVRIGAQMAILSSQNNSQVASGHENSNDSITGIIPLSIHSVSDVRAGSGSVGSRVVSIDPFVCDGEKGSGAGLSLRVPPVSITKGHRAPEVLMNAAAIHDTTTAAEQAATSALIPEGGGEHSRSPSPNRPADELWKSLAMRVRREVSVVSAFRRYRRDVTMLSHPSSPISPMLANRRSTSIPQSPSPIKL